MFRLISYVLIFIVGFAVCAGLYSMAPNHPGITTSAAGPAITAGPTVAAASPTSGPATTAGPGTTIYAVSKVEPSVVNIDITGTPIQQPSEMGPFGMPSPFSRGGGEVTPQGTASGVIISSDGYILTNNHVAADTSAIRVTLHDGRRFNARVVGLDPKSDLAVIKVDATGLPAATIGDSTQVKVGQWVIAVGNPLGIGTTATAGIISAIRSPFDIKGRIFPEIIQTDAAINPGNSGGALADLNGSIIGINSAIASTNGGSIGIGFSIPIKMAMEHAHQLIQYKSVSYPWMGVAYQAQQPDQPMPAQGALVSKVVEGSPAASAGIQPGDILTHINNTKIDEPEKVNFLTMQHKPGDTVDVTVWRDGQTRHVKVTLGRLPAELENPQPADMQPPDMQGQP